MNRRYGENGKIIGVDINPSYLKKFNIIDTDDESCKINGIRINIKNNAAITMLNSTLCTDILIEKDVKDIKDVYTNIAPEIVDDVLCALLGVDKLVNVLGNNEQFVKKAHPSIYDYINYIGCDSIKDITIHIGMNTIFDGGNYIEFPIDNNLVGSIHFNEKNEMFMIGVSIGSPNGNQYEYNQTLAFFRKMKFVDVINFMF